MEKKITRYYEAYMKFSRKCLEGFAEHDELNIDMQMQVKKIWPWHWLVINTTAKTITPNNNYPPRRLRGHQY